MNQVYDYVLTVVMISIDDIRVFGTAVLKLSVLLFVIMMSMMIIKMTDDRRQMTDDCDLLLGRGLVAETEILGERPASIPHHSLQTSHAYFWNDLMTAL
jgi:hypothetical protein